jgi:DsbC/DsbD-like thiol-disulfide interchange protein
VIGVFVTFIGGVLPYEGLMNMQNIIRAAVFGGLSFGGACGAVAQGLPADIVKAEVIGGWRTADGTQMAALHLTLADGWKTYWRAPGEGGIPPRFDWAGSENVASVVFHWPQPEVFDLSGMRTLGYKHELTLPMEFTPKVAGQPMKLAADVELGVCEEVCVPVSLQIGADLPDGTVPDPAIAAALAAQPKAAPAAGLKSARCAVDPIRDGVRLTATLDIPSVGADEFAVVEVADQNIWVSRADFKRVGNTATAVVDVVPPTAAPFALSRADVRITLFGGGHAVELNGCAS